MPAPNDIDSLAAILEPLAVNRSYAYSFDRMTVVDASQAVSTKRLADAAERIAAALETLAGHLAPTADPVPGSYQRPLYDTPPAPGKPFAVGDRVRGIEGNRKDTGTVDGVRSGQITVAWDDSPGVPGQTWWPTTDFEPLPAEEGTTE